MFSFPGTYSYAMSSPTNATLHVQQLFVRHHRQLTAYVLTLWPDFCRADDVVQEVFLTVTAKAADFQPGTNFLAWAKSIARLKILEARRKEKGLFLGAEILESLDVACPEGWGDERRLEALTECMKSLPPRAQELIRLRYESEHPLPEVARLLARTAASVSVSLHRARVALRDCIDRRLAEPGAAGTAT